MNLITYLLKTFIPRNPQPVRITCVNASRKPVQTVMNKTKSSKSWFHFGFNKRSKTTQDDDYPARDSDFDESVDDEDHFEEEPFSVSSNLDDYYDDFENNIDNKDDSIDNDNEDHKKTKEIILEQDEEPFISVFDKAIAFCVGFSGTIYMLILLLIIVIIWMIIGIIYKAPDNWQIVMEDGQSIQTYVWDTFLMRQQLDDTDKFLRLFGTLKSRSLTHRKLMKRLLEQYSFEMKRTDDITESSMEPSLDESQSNSFCQPNLDENSPKLSYFDKVSNLVSKVLGSLPFITIYWIGIFIWIGCGALDLSSGNSPPFTGKYAGSNPEIGHFTNEWQMYINTAVALELLITSVFLENIRARNNASMRGQIELYSTFDAKLESLLRKATKFRMDNPSVIVRPCPRNGMKKYISLYAEIIGTGLGLVISVCVFAAWFGIGNLLHWNSNWWLIIGTYTGLVGFIDGFVLREVYFDITGYEEAKYDSLLSDSQELLNIAGIQHELKVPKDKDTISFKISNFVNKICSNKWSVVFSVLVVIGLICAASGMRWSTTGQLICNTPTMIIEGFFLLILIQAHNWAHVERSEIFKQMIVSRQLLYDLFLKIN